MRTRPPEGEGRQAVMEDVYIHTYIAGHLQCHVCMREEERLLLRVSTYAKIGNLAYIVYTHHHLWY